MSSITILREPPQHYGLEQTGYPKDRSNCAVKEAMAEMNIIPMCRSCFAKMIKKQVGQMKKVYSALNVHA
jgi:hypothetical protein